MGYLTIGCFASLTGSMNYDFLLRLSKAAQRKGHRVSIWFSGNGSSSIKKGQKILKDYSHGEKHLRELISNGVEICVCESCAYARGIMKEDVIEGAKWSAMHWFLSKIYEADRVLLIGGE